MFIKKVIVDQVRNLSHVSLEGFESFNLLVGPNGSGKTSFLEAVALASQGRSFRSHKIAHVINHEDSTLSVFIEAEDRHGLNHRIGIRRNRQNQFQVRVNGEGIHSLAELSQVLPILVIDNEAFQLLDGSASVRSRFLDWGVFHVKHEFYHQWRIYSRALKQRNELLKSGHSNQDEYDVWDEHILNAGFAITQYRLAFLQVFNIHFLQYAKMFDPLFADIALGFKTGWDRVNHDVCESMPTDWFDEGSLSDKFRSNLSQDIRYKRTQLGAHRADLHITINKMDARDVLSRGQKKSLICALKLAMAKTLKQTMARYPVLLLDDLPAELDTEHLNAVLSVINDEQYQAFITSVDTQLGNNNMPLKARMFHVEHGKISTANGDINA
ncbi:DNA replication and repair protein RecF [BD1-7 clade bacterium]|uniref:DNA replication and repair protein RecF n=1 Tax=BD1-7 clade bacterium TaxID=2029982 RepID=A0A5S9N0B1_9GAMM|nr:DNA replication and repair protein RecF [BD1-7 clade bacterium]